MNRKQLLLSGALIVLLAMDAYAVYLYGFIGFFRVHDAYNRRSCILFSRFATWLPS